jgi:hypothetical protein
MKETSKTNDAYRQAKKRVNEVRGFYAHLFMYVLVNVVLLVINLIFTPQFLWFLFPLFGWGIGLLAHAVFGFGLFGIFTKEWEETKIKEILEKRKSAK